MLWETFTTYSTGTQSEKLRYNEYVIWICLLQKIQRIKKKKANNLGRDPRARYNCLFYLQF